MMEFHSHRANGPPFISKIGYFKMFRIRYSDGKYASGLYPSRTKTGKVWVSETHLRQHLGQYYSGFRYYGTPPWASSPGGRMDWQDIIHLTQIPDNHNLSWMNSSKIVNESTGEETCMAEVFLPLAKSYFRKRGRL